MFVRLFADSGIVVAGGIRLSFSIVKCFSRYCTIRSETSPKFLLRRGWSVSRTRRHLLPSRQRRVSRSLETSPSGALGWLKSPQQCGFLISRRRGLARCTRVFRNVCIRGGIFRGLWQLGMRVTRQQAWFNSWCGTNVWTSLNHWLAKEAIRLLKQLPLLLTILSLLWIQAPRNLYQQTTSHR